MKRIVLSIALAMIALTGGAASASDLTGLASGELSGAATAIDPASYAIEATISITNVVSGSRTIYDCAVTAQGAPEVPFPNDELLWAVACTDGEAGTFTADLSGGNRPLRRNPPGVDTGAGILQFGGPVVLNGDAQGHVATCKGVHQFPSLRFACVIL